MNFAARGDSKTRSNLEILDSDVCIIPFSEEANQVLKVRVVYSNSHKFLVTKKFWSLGLGPSLSERIFLCI